MGKKKKNNISWNPLQATTIGKIKQNRFGWIGIILLFGIFFGIIYYLPDLQDIYNKYVLGQNVTNNTTDIANNEVTNNTTPGNETPTEKPEKIKYTFQDKTSFEFPEFTITNIRLFSNDLSFKITNLVDDNFNLSLKNYFFEFYDEYGGVIQTIYLTGEFADDETKSYKFTINEPDAIEKFSLSVLTEDDYPDYEFSEDENNQIVLACTNEYRNITYTISEDKLINTVDNVNYPSSLNDYAKNEEYFKNLYDDFSEQTGYTVSYNVNNNGFTFNNTIDYNLLSASISEDVYFSINTSPKTIRFKMESLGYSCK